MQELEQENEAFKQSEQEAIEIIADLKHQLSLYKNSHKTEQDRRRKFENALEEIREINNKWLKRWRDDSDELAGFEEIENRINEVLQ